MIIIIMIIFAIIGFGLAIIGDFIESDNLRIVGVIFIILGIVTLFFGMVHGFIDYDESNDKDLARITAITQEQDFYHTYFRIEVEYLTNTPTQEGIVVNKNIEKETFYCYLENKDLVEKVKNNLYKQVWIITGYKGGYETPKDFGNKLLKYIELLEE